jgi:hypothetical protein
VGADVADPRDPAEIAKRLGEALRLVQGRWSTAAPARWGDDAVRADFHVDRVRRDFTRIIQDVARRPSMPDRHMLRIGEA